MTTRDIEFEGQLAMGANNPSINSFAAAHSEGRLELRPPFQRNLVWNKDQQSYLIDSILRNLPVPEMYLHTSVDAAGVESMVVVDGQQRLTACLRFLQGELRLVGDGLDPRWDGRTFNELPEPLQLRFRNYRMLVRELPEMGEPELREIFRRLNRVVEPLTPQELRHAAYTGPYIRLIESAAAHPSLQQVGVFTARDYRRRGNDELIAEVTLAVASRAFPNKKEGLEESFIGYERHGFPDSLRLELAQRFGRLFDQVNLITPDIRKTRFSNKSDFYSLAVLLLNRAEQLPLSPQDSARLVGSLSDLTSRIANLREVEAENPQYAPEDERGILVSKYTRAVERAASDRLNRVRRNEVLVEWLGPALASSDPRSLETADALWLDQVDSEAVEAEEEELDMIHEKEHLQEVLLESEEE